MDAQERPWVLHFLDKQKKKYLAIEAKQILKNNWMRGSSDSPFKGDVHGCTNAASAGCTGAVKPMQRLTPLNMRSLCDDRIYFYLFPTTYNCRSSCEKMPPLFINATVLHIIHPKFQAITQEFKLLLFFCWFGSIPCYVMPFAGKQLIA
jgi:hypothetical protein